LLNREWLHQAGQLILNFLKSILVLILCFAIYAKFVEPNWIDIHKLQLTLPHLAAEFNGYRIVQISDLHRDSWMTPEKLEHIVNLVNDQKPDLIVITGDLVTRKLPELVPSVGIALAKLHAQDRILSVLGNNDIENNPVAIIETLEQHGITHIDNGIYTINRGSAMLHIVGIGDFCLGYDRLNLVLPHLPTLGAAILLVHEPDFADISAVLGRFDLQLSGHSHGGQIRFPGFNPLYLPFYGKKYYAGLYQVQKMLLYTNRGLGMSELHLRFGARPEITVFTLLS
jgi:predicted MPP superfamily phosphohydrolase